MSRLEKLRQTMIVNVDEAELSRRYSGFVTPQSLLTCLTDGKGTVLSSTDKEMLGTVFPVFNTVSKAWRQQGSGCVTAGLEGQRGGGLLREKLCK